MTSCDDWGKVKRNGLEKSKTRPRSTTKETRMKACLYSLSLIALVLTGCAATQATSQAPTTEPPVIGMPAPGYLQVPDFQKCLASQQQGSYQTWCLPAQRPDQCPQASWQQLQQLPVGQQVPACRAKDA